MGRFAARWLVTLALPGLLLLAGWPAVAAESAALSAALDSVRPAEMQRVVNVLADDTFEGREAGSRGGQAAGAWLVQRLEAAHLQPAGGGKSYYQAYEGNSRNLLGLWEGSDPELKKQVILVGAHYDHVGYGTANNSYGPLGRIHHGADDNASGVAGLLQTIAAIEQLPERPKRTLLFALWDGEEKGLLGSQHWMAAPTVPLNRLVLAFNMDMIGRLRNQRIEVFGARSAPGLRRMLCEQNQRTNLWLDFNWDLKADSDHHSSLEHNIPTLMLFTGLHPDYHRPSDLAEKVDADGMKLVVQLLVSTLVETANAERLPKFRPTAREEAAIAAAAREPIGPPPAARLGVRWQTDADRPGLRVTGVDAGTAAVRAGIKLQDRIVEFVGREITNEAEFRALVLAAEPACQMVVERGTEHKRANLDLKLAGQPTRFGLAWRADPAEPGAVVLSRVTPSSPAALAGLKPNDRIYKVDGQDFSGVTAFAQLLAGDQPIELQVEHRGRLRNVALTPLTTGVAIRLGGK